MSSTTTDERKLPLWDQVLGLLEEDLAERRSRKVVVEVPGESGSYRNDLLFRSGRAASCSSSKG